MTNNQPTTEATAPELSAVVVFADCEDSIGSRVGALVQKLRGLGRDFELIAVNSGSRDNTVALLSLLAQRYPELRVLARDAGTRAFAHGALSARAPLLVMLGFPRDDDALPCLAPMGWAVSRVASQSDAVVVRGGFAVARRARALPVLARVRGEATDFEHEFLQAAQHQRGLRVDVFGAQKPTGLWQSLSRALAAPLRRLPFAARA